MVQTIFTAISVVCTVLSGLSYIRATLKGEAQPNRVTWFLWGTAPLIGGAAQLASGVGVSTLVVLSSGVMPMLVFIASFANRNAYWRLTPVDYLCGAASLLALLLWALTRHPVVAIVFSLLADMLAAVPTIRKFFTHPESEDRRSYLLAAAGNTIGLFGITEYTFTSTAFNAYLAVMTLTFLPLLFRRELRALFGRPASDDKSQTTRLD